MSGTPHHYPIPAVTTRIETEVSKSRFIATIGFAETVEAARTFINDIRHEFPDASSYIYAFKVGYGSSTTEGMSDGGEPTGTAGPPALAVIHGADLGDVVLTITRYFGGIKLGTGGLVHAFGDAARAALAALPVRPKIALRQVGISAPYPLYERIKLITAAHHGVIDSEEFGGEVTLYVTLPLDDLPAYRAAIIELSAGRVTPVEL
jgi:uncharacterized YigZ family protein